MEWSTKWDISCLKWIELLMLFLLLSSNFIGSCTFQKLFLEKIFVNFNENPCEYTFDIDFSIVYESTYILKQSWNLCEFRSFVMCIFIKHLFNQKLTDNFTLYGFHFTALVAILHVHIFRTFATISCTILRYITFVFGFSTKGTLFTKLLFFLGGVMIKIENKAWWCHFRNSFNILIWLDVYFLN